MIQSNSCSPTELIRQTEIFLEEFIANFEILLPEERFREIQSSLLTSLSSPSNNLAEMAKALSQRAFGNKAEFMQVAKHAAALRRLTYEELYLYTKACFSSENENRFSVSIEGI